MFIELANVAEASVPYANKAVTPEESDELAQAKEVMNELKKPNKKGTAE